MFVAGVVLRWLSQWHIETTHIDPGKPWQNVAGVSFNGELQDECLSLEWFRDRIDAKILIEAWRRHDSETQPMRVSATGHRPISKDRVEDQSA